MDNIIRKAGFVIHPVHDDPESVKATLAKRYGFVEKLPAKLVKGLFPYIPVKRLRCGQSDEIISPTGAKCTLTLWGVPNTPDQMVRRQPVGQVIEAATYLRDEGCEVIGLGAYTSIIGKEGGGVEIAKEMITGITTGNSLTAATGIEGLVTAASKIGYDLEDPNLCTLIIGAGGSIGRACAHLIQEETAGRILLYGRDSERVRNVASELGCNRVDISHNLNQAIAQADLIVTVTSATSSLDINPSLFKSGAVIVDIARPRDIGTAVREARKDVLVIDGAILKTPNMADMGFDFGFPKGTVYACMAETLVLTLEGIHGNYSIGRELDLDKVRQIARLAKKHGFELCGFRGYDEVIPESKFDEMRRVYANLRRT